MYIVCNTSEQRISIFEWPINQFNSIQFKNGESLNLPLYSYFFIFAGEEESHQGREAREQEKQSPQTHQEEEREDSKGTQKHQEMMILQMIRIMNHIL